MLFDQGERGPFLLGAVLLSQRFGVTMPQTSGAWSCGCVLDDRHPMPSGLTFDQVKHRYEVEVGQTGRHMDISEVLVHGLSISKLTTGREPPRAYCVGQRRWVS